MLRLARRGLDAGRRSTTSSPSPSAEDLRAARAEVDATEVHDEVVGYVVAIVRRTRELPSVTLGASPRAAVHLLGAAKAAARLAGRAYVTPDDVARMAAPVLRHRLVLTPEAELERATPDGRHPRRARGRPGAPMTRGEVGTCSHDGSDRTRPIAATRPTRAARWHPHSLTSGFPLSPAPRAVAALAVLARRALLIPIGRSRSLRWRSSRRSRSTRGRAPARRSRRDKRPRCCSRGIPAPLTITRHRPRAAASASSARRRCPTRACARRAADDAITALRRGRHTLPAVALAPPARSGSPAGTTRPRETAELRVFPDLHDRAPARARRRPRPLPRPGRRRARPARPRHRVRADPRLPARRRHPPGQLARDRAARAADEQPVPARAGPRPACC